MTTYPLQTPPASSDRRKLLAGILGGAVLLATTAGAWYLWPARLPSPDSSTVDLVKFAATEQFALLDASKKAPYVDKLSKIPMPELFKAAGEAKLTDDQRRNAMENTMGLMMQKRTEAYFALPTPAERLKFLDGVIDEQEKMRTSMAGRIGSAMRGGGGGGRGGGGADPARMKRRAETRPPERSAAMAEFIGAMVDRRKERGLPEFGPPGRR